VLAHLDVDICACFPLFIVCCILYSSLINMLLPYVTFDPNCTENQSLDRIISLAASPLPKWASSRTIGAAPVPASAPAPPTATNQIIHRVRRPRHIVTVGPLRSITIPPLNSTTEEISTDELLWTHMPQPYHLSKIWRVNLNMRCQMRDTEPFHQMQYRRHRLTCRAVPLNSKITDKA